MERYISKTYYFKYIVYEETTDYLFVRLFFVVVLMHINS